MHYNHSILFWLVKWCIIIIIYYNNDCDTIKESLNDNNLATGVSLNGYTASAPYVTPSDGYLEVHSNYGSEANYTKVHVYSASTTNYNYFAVEANATVSHGQTITVFVKKDMRMFINIVNNGSATFFPLS